MAAPKRTDRATGTAHVVTDGGMETDLIFNRGVDLPEFAAYPLLFTGDGRDLLADYYSGCADIARSAGAALLLESPTWRASAEWGARLGHDATAVAQANTVAIGFLRTLAATWPDLDVTVVGMIGPRGDGYAAGAGMDPQDAADYHRPQLEAFAAAGADRATAYTMTDVGEALGIVRAAADCALPVGISFTLETDGRLPGGGELGQAAEQVLEVAPGTLLLLNCAHPSHLTRGVTTLRQDLRSCFVGVRINASPKSHAELDEAEELDAGDIGQLVAAQEELSALLPDLQIVGGCCGTDTPHVAALWGVA